MTVSPRHGETGALSIAAGGKVLLEGWVEIGAAPQLHCSGCAQKKCDHVSTQRYLQ